MQLTYNQLIEVFTDLASKHYQIQSIEQGEISDVDISKKDATNFPLLFVEPNQAAIDKGTLLYSIDFMVMTLIQADEDNLTEAYSNMLQISNDIISEFRQVLSSCSFVSAEQKPDIILVTPVVLQPFTRRFSNLLTGWGGTLQIEVGNKLDLSIAPIEQS